MVRKSNEEKIQTSMRLTASQKAKIFRKYETIQAFVEAAYKEMFRRRTK